VTLIAVSLLTVILAALSNAVRLLVRQQEALIGTVSFLSCRCRSCPRRS